MNCIGGVLNNLDEIYKCLDGDPMKVLLQGFEMHGKTIKIWLLIVPEMADD